MEPHFISIFLYVIEIYQEFTKSPQLKKMSQEIRKKFPGEISLQFPGNILQKILPNTVWWKINMEIFPEKIPVGYFPTDFM